MVDQTRGPGRVVAGNVLALVGARGAVAVAGLISLPVIYARLGTVEFGIWVVLSGLGTVVSLADLGLGSAIVRQVATFVHDGAIRRCRIALGVGLVWGIALALIGGAAVMALWPALVALLHLQSAASSARWATLALLFSVLMDGVSMPWRGILEGTQRYQVLSRITGSTSVLGAVLAVVAVQSGGRMFALALTVAAVAILRAVLIILAARRFSAALSPSLTGVSRADLRSIGGYGLRVQVTSASGAVNVELDRFILTGFFGPAVAGGFDLGGRVVGLFRLLPVFALVAMFPMAVSRGAQLGKEWLDHFDLAATKYLTAFAAVGAAGLVACADPFIRLWLGQPNWWATANIAILAPAYALNIASGATGILSRVEGRPGRETSYAVLSVVLNLALTWPLLHLLGPLGVTLATAVGVTIATIYFLVSYHRVTDRPLRPLARVMWPSVAAALVAGSVANALGSYLPDGPGRLGAAEAVLCRGSIVLLIAAGVLTATGFLRSDEVAAARQAVRRATTKPSPAVEVAK